MAIRRILNKRESMLRKKSRPVDMITDRIRTLIADMEETLREVGGVGLAAPQVGVLRRAIVVMDDDGTYIPMLNPEIVGGEGEQHEIEGCLSCPNEYGITTRPAKVTIRAQGLDGSWFELTREGMTARCFCHETDHLNGILFLDHAEMVDPADYETK